MMRVQASDTNKTYMFIAVLPAIKKKGTQSGYSHCLVIHPSLGLAGVHLASWIGAKLMEISFTSTVIKN